MGNSKTAFTTHFRLIQKDGSLNIHTRKGITLRDLYHDLLRTNWRIFSLVWALAFFLMNNFFGFLYFILPVDQFEGFRHPEGFPHYLEGFFFSVQTFGTIGYGKVSPVGLAANFVMTLECYTSLFVVAVMTGLIFARFAKPNAKIIFSKNAVIQKFDGVPSLMFRIANARQNYVTDARVRLTLAVDEPNTGYRTFIDLKLERESSPIFALSWTIVHDIDESSPLHPFSPEKLCDRNSELIVTFNGVDTTLSQNVFAKYSYITEEILENVKFADVIRRNKDDGTVELMLEQFHEVSSI
jgi:inward rectifier potassium channel